MSVRIHPDWNCHERATDNRGKPIPALERSANGNYLCNSWVAVCRKTGKPVYETSNMTLAEGINQNRYEVLTALQWLQRFNASVRG